MTANLADKVGFTLMKNKSAKRRDRKRLRGTTIYADAAKGGISQQTVKVNTKGKINKGSLCRIHLLKSSPKEFVFQMKVTYFTSKQVWERVTKVVDPMTDGLAIHKTCNLESGGILISAESEVDIAKLEAELGETKSNANLFVS